CLLWTAIRGSAACQMGIRLSSISLSKYSILLATQFVVNISLAVWLYNEYLHNQFMQVYVSNVWSAIWPEVAIAIGVGAGATAVLAVYRRGDFPVLCKKPVQTSGIRAVGTVGSLDAIDACPFCETPLKTISEGRLQCRNCRRYFKSGMPKIP